MSDDFKNMRIKLFEEFGNYREINISMRCGNVFGVMHTNRKHFEKWIVEECLDDEVRGFFAMFPDRKLLPIAIMKNLNFAEAAIGNDLMRSFLNEASDAKNVVLIADVTDKNNFDIVEWYAGWGFTQIGKAGEHPVMVLNNY